MNADQMKDWAWSWAAKLDADITCTHEWFSEVSGMAARIPATAADAYQTALSWTVAAYYEYKKGRWSRERAEAQISEAASMIEMLGGLLS